MSHPSDIPSFDEGTVPARLLARLDRLGEVLAERGDSVALIGLGSVGTDLYRLDEHSDADFFVVVESFEAQRRYIDSIDWLEALGEVAFSFENSPHGRKVLWDDGLFGEYAVFALEEMATAGYPPGRLVWARANAPAGIENPVAPLPPVPLLEEQVGEALTNLWVGLHRDLRGERLTAMRFIQVHALDRLMTVLDLVGAASRARQDVFVIERGAERRFTSEELPLDRLAPGYTGNAGAALALLEMLERHVAVNARLASDIRELARRAG
jgi:hypothetical protein